MSAVTTALLCGSVVAWVCWIQFARGHTRLRRLVALQQRSNLGTANGQHRSDWKTVGPTAKTARWNQRLRKLYAYLFGPVHQNESEVEALSFDLELAAICLQSGLPTDKALALAAQATDNRTGLAKVARSLELGETHSIDSTLAPVASLIEFSRSTGVALAPLLIGLATDLRRAEHRRRSLAAARLGVKLVIPLGVCVLPSFVLMGVVPVLLTLTADISQVFR